jgi:mRNA interferase MazF
MKKDFQKWHHHKQDIDDAPERVFFKEREIWMCSLGENIGFEQDGRGDEFLRPVVVLKKFNNAVLWIIPLTRTDKRDVYYFPFSFDDDEISVAIISQIRLIDAKRLKYKAGDIKIDDFDALKSKIRQLLA